MQFLRGIAVSVAYLAGLVGLAVIADLIVGWVIYRARRYRIRENSPSHQGGQND